MPVSPGRGLWGWLFGPCKVAARVAGPKLRPLLDRMGKRHSRGSSLSGLPGALRPFAACPAAFPFASPQARAIRSTLGGIPEPGEALGTLAAEVESFSSQAG